VHRDGDPRIQLLGDFSGLAGGDGVKASRNGNEQYIDLAQHLELIRGKHMAEIAQMGNADVIHAKDEDSVFPSLEAVAFVVVGGNIVNRNVANRGVNFLPVFAGGGEAVKNDRISGRHLDAIVRAMLMTGGDDMLGQSGPRQVESAVGIGQYPGSL